MEKIKIQNQLLEEEKAKLFLELNEIDDLIAKETDAILISDYEKEKKEILEDIDDVNNDIDELSEFIEKFNESSAENIDTNSKLEIEKPTNNLQEIENKNEEVVNSIDESSKKDLQKFENEKLESVDNQQYKYPQKKKKNQKVQNLKSKSSK
jgi:hypothetical protein